MTNWNRCLKQKIGHILFDFIDDNPKHLRLGSGLYFLYFNCCLEDHQLPNNRELRFKALYMLDYDVSYCDPYVLNDKVRDFVTRKFGVVKFSGIYLAFFSRRGIQIVHISSYWNLVSLSLTRLPLIKTKFSMEKILDHRRRSPDILESQYIIPDPTLLKFYENFNI